MMQASVMAYLMALLLMTDSTALVTAPTELGQPEAPTSTEAVQQEPESDQPAIGLCIGVKDGRATVIQTDGKQREIPNTVGAAVSNVVLVDADDGLEVVRPSSNIEGTFDWEAHMLGDIPVSPDVRILDSYYSADYTKCKAVTVSSPERLDGLKCNISNIRYLQKNEDGVITDIILKDATGDVYTYGVVTDTSFIATEPTQYTFKIRFGDEEKTYQIRDRSGAPTPNEILAGSDYYGLASIQRGDAVRTMIFEDDTLYRIEELKVKKIKLPKQELDEDTLILEKTILREIPSFQPGNAAMIDDRAALEVFYDKEPDEGGRPRVITVYHAIK